MTENWTSGDIFQVKLNFDLGYTYLKLRWQKEPLIKFGQNFGFFFDLMPLEILNQQPIVEFDNELFSEADHLCGIVNCSRIPKSKLVKSNLKPIKYVGTSKLNELEEREIFTRHCQLWHLCKLDHSKGEWEVLSQDDNMEKDLKKDKPTPFYLIKHLGESTNWGQQLFIWILTFLWIRFKGIAISDFDFSIYEKDDLILINEMKLIADNYVLYNTIPKELWHNIQEGVYVNRINSNY